MFSQSFAQDSLKTNDLFSVKPKYLIPESRSDIQFQSLNLNYNDLNMKNRYNYTPDHLRQSPFGVDTRYSSFYTPRLVRDELNLMMHRPRDSAFMPILGVAFIAIQMASKYLLVERELQIKTSNILNCEPQLPILEALWEKNPQTCDQLYRRKVFNEKYTYHELEKDINHLMDQNLVKSKRMEDDSIQYFPALDKPKMQYTLKMGRKDPLITTAQVNQIDSLLIYFGNTAP